MTLISESCYLMIMVHCLAEYIRTKLKKIFNESVLEIKRLNGFMHDNYLVSTRSHTFVVKIPFDDRFIGNLYNEYNVLTKISSLNISPQVLFFDDTTFTSPILCLEFISGTTLKSIHNYFDSLCALLKSVNMKTLSPVMWKYNHNYFDLFIKNRIHYLEQLNYRTVIENYMSDLENAAKEISDTNYLVHGDLRFDNLILSESGRIYLIDWEYAGIGDIGFDFANLVVEHDLNLDDLSRLLNCYNNSGDLVLHIIKLVPLVRAANILWTEIMLASNYKPKYKEEFKKYISYQIKNLMSDFHDS